MPSVCSEEPHRRMLMSVLPRATTVTRSMKKPFDAVLIDEACQAAEVAALQPLVHGTSKVGVNCKVVRGVKSKFSTSSLDFDVMCQLAPLRLPSVRVCRQRTS
jgi:hypothetical protein